MSCTKIQDPYSKECTTIHTWKGPNGASKESNCKDIRKKDSGESTCQNTDGSTTTSEWKIDETTGLRNIEN